MNETLYKTHGAFQSMGLSPMARVLTSTSCSPRSSGTAYFSVSWYGCFAASRRRTVCVSGLGIGSGSTCSSAWGRFCVPSIPDDGTAFRLGVSDRRRKKDVMMLRRIQRRLAEGVMIRNNRQPGRIIRIVPLKGPQLSPGLTEEKPHP